MWLRQKLGSETSLAMKTLQWAGVASKGSTSLEVLLRFKCLILVSVALKRRSIRWWKQLPAVVKERATYGQVCCLFWPPPDGSAAELSYKAEDWLDWWQRSTLAKSAQLLVQVHAYSTGLWL